MFQNMIVTEIWAAWLSCKKKKKQLTTRLSGSNSPKWLLQVLLRSNTHFWGVHMALGSLKNAFNAHQQELCGSHIGIMWSAFLSLLWLGIAVWTKHHIYLEKLEVWFRDKSQSIGKQSAERHSLSQDEALHHPRQAPVNCLFSLIAAAILLLGPKVFKSVYGLVDVSVVCLLCFYFS